MNEIDFTDVSKALQTEFIYFQCTNDQYGYTYYSRHIPKYKINTYELMEN